MAALEPRPTRAPFNYGYIIVGAAILTMYLIQGATYCFGIFFKPLVIEFSSPPLAPQPRAHQPKQNRRGIKPPAVN